MANLKNPNEFAEIVHDGKVIAVVYMHSDYTVTIVPNRSEKVDINCDYGDK